MKHTTLPDLAASASKLKLVMDLMGIQHQSVFAEAIRNGAKDNPKACIAMIKSQAHDNRALVAEIVGEELLGRIERMYGTWHDVKEVVTTAYRCSKCGTVSNEMKCRCI